MTLLHRHSRLAIVIVAVSAAAVLPGCATITQGSSQTLTVNTDPVGAGCELSRMTKSLGRVSPTPGTIHLPKERAAVTVVCNDEGYQQEQQVVDTHFTGATFGNILLGGGIGIIVDAATGANFALDPTRSLFLMPASFSSEAERDQYLERARGMIKADMDAQRKEAEKKSKPEVYRQQLVVFDKKEKDLISGIEAKARNAKVATLAGN